MQDLEFRQLVERLKLRAPIEVVVGERVEDLKPAGAILKARCPFHEERTPSFTVDPRRGTWRCWGACAEGGDAISFVERFDGVDFRDALRVLAQIAGEDLPEDLFRSGRRGAGSSEEDPRYGVLARAAKLYAARLVAPDGDGHEALAYLEERGLERATLERFGIGWAPREGSPLLTAATEAGVSLRLLLETGLVRRSEQGRAYDFFRGRFLVPIRDRLGRTVGFGGRILPEDSERAERAGRPQAKYVNTPETELFHKGRLIYGLDLATRAVRSARHLVLVEGYTDVMAAHQCGLEYVAAVLGTATTDDHAALVRRSGAKRVTLVFDGDEAGRRASRRALHGLLPLGLDLRVATPPAGSDPCDLLLAQGAAAFEALLEEAPPWFAWAADQLAGLDGAALGEGVDELFELLERLEKPVERAARVEELAERLGLPRDAVQAQWRAFEGRRSRRAAARPAAAPDGSPGREAPTAQESEVESLEPAERQAYEALLGALLLDNSLIPLHRELADDCPAGTLRRLYEALFALYDDVHDDRPIDAGRVISALGDDPARRRVVPIEEMAALAESPQALARDQELWLQRRRHERTVRELRGRRAAAAERLGAGDGPEDLRILQNLHEELRRWRVPTADGSSRTP